MIPCLSVQYWVEGWMALEGNKSVNWKRTSGRWAQNATRMHRGLFAVRNPSLQEAPGGPQQAATVCRRDNLDQLTSLVGGSAARSISYAMPLPLLLVAAAGERPCHRGCCASILLLTVSNSPTEEGLRESAQQSATRMLTLQMQGTWHEHRSPACA